MTEREIDERLRRLKEKTKRYWMECDRSGLDYISRARLYIEILLEDELDLAKARGRLPDVTQLPDARCDRLVLLVGLSFEPLLQAIRAYQPAEVVPVLNESYGESLPGRAMWRRLDQVVGLLKNRGLIPASVVLRNSDPLTRDTPSEVFRFLRRCGNAGQGTTTVVDITGGKKSMVAGAFLYAAYSNTPISYVDFDDDFFDEQFRRPYGCSCLIGLIDNPFQEFSLRDWERVERLYGQHAFAAARRTLEEVIGVMGASRHFDREEVGAAWGLARVLEVYEAWDNGDYRRAQETSRGLASVSDALPPSIALLGPIWPHAESGNAGDASDQLLLLYLTSTTSLGSIRFRSGALLSVNPSIEDAGGRIVGHRRKEETQRFRVHNEDCARASVFATGGEALVEANPPEPLDRLGPCLERSGPEQYLLRLIPDRE